MTASAGSARVGAVVAAGGRGERLGAAVPKALVLLAGEPLVLHARRALEQAGVSDVVVAAPAEHVDELAALLPGTQVVAGGDTRTASVRRALAALPDSVDIVLVHDAARALAPAALMTRVADAVRAGADAVVPVVAVADTLKEVDASGRVLRTVDRTQMRAVQTPQGFRRAVLVAAHDAAGADADATDDAALVERLGVAVETVPGAYDALKVTTRADLLVAETLLRDRSAANDGVTT